MRNLWRMILCTGLVVGVYGAAAAHEVKIWVPTPVKAEPARAPVVDTDVEVVSVVVVTDRQRCRISNDYGLDYRYGGCSPVSFPSRYPF